MLEKSLLDKCLCVLSCISVSLAEKKESAEMIVVVFGLLLMEKKFLCTFIHFCVAKIEDCKS